MNYLDMEVGKDYEITLNDKDGNWYRVFHTLRFTKKYDNLELYRFEVVNGNIVHLTINQLENATIKPVK